VYALSRRLMETAARDQRGEKAKQRKELAENCLVAFRVLSL